MGSEMCIRDRDCQFFDPLPFSDDGFVSPEVDIRWCDVAQTFMVTLVIIILHECPDLTFKRESDS